MQVLVAALESVRQGREPDVDPDEAYERAIAEARGEAVDPYELASSPRDEVNANLRRLREEAGLTQEQLAGVMEGAGFGWTRNTVTEIDRRTRRLSYEELWGAAVMFGVPVASLLAPEDGHALQLNEVITVTGRRATELLIGKGGNLGAGGAVWAAAAHAVPEGVSRPARELWRNRRLGEGN